MFKIILAFVFVFGLFFFGIQAVRSLTGKEAWALTKTLAYCTICTVLTIAALTTLVILF